MKELPLQRIFDLAVDEGLVPEVYFYDWYRFAQWPLGALKKIGLEPRHRFLDVGCGAARAGMYLVPYLDEGNYCGMDAFAPYIRCGRKILEAAEVGKNFQVRCSSDFTFKEFGGRFDFAMAQSVFTYLARPAILRCMEALKGVMNSGGRFLVSYLPRESVSGVLYEGMQPMVNCHMSEEFLDSLAARFDLGIERVVLDHPSQRTAVYRFP